MAIHAMDFRDAADPKVPMSSEECDGLRTLPREQGSDEGGAKRLTP